MLRQSLSSQMPLHQMHHNNTSHFPAKASPALPPAQAVPHHLSAPQRLILLCLPVPHHPFQMLPVPLSPSHSAGTALLPSHKKPALSPSQKSMQVHRFSALMSFSSCASPFPLVYIFFSKLRPSYHSARYHRSTSHSHP